MHRYYFKKIIKDPEKLPGRPERYCLYNGPVYTRQFERDTFGWVEYSKPLEPSDVEKCGLMEDNRNRLRYMMKG
jgi:hypothetical protein